MLGHGGVVEKLHRVITPALRSRPEMGCVTKHLIQRDVGYNIFEVIPVAKLCDSSSSRRKVSDNRSKAVARDMWGSEGWSATETLEVKGAE
jgi:hypothetical protein